jgi:hypothetical protein
MRSIHPLTLRGTYLIFMTSTAILALLSLLLNFLGIIPIQELENMGYFATIYVEHGGSYDETIWKIRERSGIKKFRLRIVEDGKTIESSPVFSTCPQDMATVIISERFNDSIVATVTCKSVREQFAFRSKLGPTRVFRSIPQQRGNLYYLESDQPMDAPPLQTLNGFNKSSRVLVLEVEPDLDPKNDTTSVNDHPPER